MDLKNTTILLLLLLCILGLIVGVYYSEASDDTAITDDDGEAIQIDSNTTVTIDLEKESENGLERFFT